MFWVIVKVLDLNLIESGNHWDFPGGSVVKNLPVDAGATRNVGSVPGYRISPGGRNVNPLQYGTEEAGGL